MQYSVPQFIEVEDQIIGPLTLKQFLTLLGAGLIILLIWRIFDVSLFFFVFALPVAFLALVLVFAKFNGRPLAASFISLIQFYTIPRYRIFKRTSDTMPMIKKRDDPTKKINRFDQRDGQSGDQKSRLRKLAYVLDQKTAEEERLIHSGVARKQWLNQI